MRSAKVILLGLTILGLAGCHHWHHHPHDGHFCPPGQAKKGNC